MLPWDRIEQVRRLLAAGELSQREIARRTGVSRGTVNSVARGRIDPERRRRAVDVPEPFPRPGRGVYVRCPECGGMVQMPCLACRIRATSRTARRTSRC